MTRHTVINDGLVLAGLVGIATVLAGVDIAHGLHALLVLLGGAIAQVAAL